jgi:hypothetical protein
MGNPALRCRTFILKQGGRGFGAGQDSWWSRRFPGFRWPGTKACTANGSTGWLHRALPVAGRPDQGTSSHADVLGGIGAMVVFAIVRRFAGRWRIWGSLAGRELAILAVAIAPVNIQPIFSKINRLDDPKVTTPILRIGSRQRHSRARRFTRLIPAARPRVSAR